MGAFYFKIEYGSGILNTTLLTRTTELHIKNRDQNINSYQFLGNDTTEKTTNRIKFCNYSWLKLYCGTDIGWRRRLIVIPITSHRALQDPPTTIGLEWYHSHLKTWHFQSALFVTDCNRPLPLFPRPVVSPTKSWEIWALRHLFLSCSFKLNWSSNSFADVSSPLSPIIANIRAHLLRYLETKSCSLWTVPTWLLRSHSSFFLFPMQEKRKDNSSCSASAKFNSPPSGLPCTWASPARHLWHYFFHFWFLVQTFGAWPDCWISAELTSKLDGLSLECWTSCKKLWMQIF